MCSAHMVYEMYGLVLSRARRALDDERGNVFLRYIDVIEAIKPTYVVIENVRGLLSAPYPYANIEEPIKGGALCIINELYQ